MIKIEVQGEINFFLCIFMSRRKKRALMIGDFVIYIEQLSWHILNSVKKRIKY
jgi:hypothetical protein